MNTIVDGYNLIFECGLEGRSRSPIMLERARDRLIAALAAKLSEEHRRRIKIVFDAKSLPIKETSNVSVRNEMTIIYAVDFEDADSLIEQLILEDSTPKKLTVVSSDHRIQKAALRRKAKAVDSGVWYDRLDKLESQAHPPSNTPETGSEKAGLEQLQDIDWKSEFGLSEPQEPADNANPSDPTKSTFNPFPPGYADDLLDELSDDDLPGEDFS